MRKTSRLEKELALLKDIDTDLSIARQKQLKLRIKELRKEVNKYGKI